MSDQLYPQSISLVFAVFLEQQKSDVQAKTLMSQGEHGGALTYCFLSAYIPKVFNTSYLAHASFYPFLLNVQRASRKKETLHLFHTGVGNQAGWSQEVFFSWL